MLSVGNGNKWRMSCMEELMAVVTDCMMRHLMNQVLEVRLGPIDSRIRFHGHSLLHTHDIRFIRNAIINFWAGP
jgi:hypothetical protein